MPPVAYTVRHPNRRKQSHEPPKKNSKLPHTHMHSQPAAVMINVCAVESSRPWFSRPRISALNMALPRALSRFRLLKTADFPTVPKYATYAKSAPIRAVSIHESCFTHATSIRRRVREISGVERSPGGMHGISTCDTGNAAVKPPFHDAARFAVDFLF